MTTSHLNVLFLCTGNSARSIMAEAILRYRGGKSFSAFSAGSQPKREVHPLALELLLAKGLPVSGAHSKSWDVFSREDAPVMDVVITVCDSAASETCPVWPGAPARAHWGIPDPASAGGSLDAQRKAFADAYRQLEDRILALIALPAERRDPSRLSAELAAIGKQMGSPA